MSRLSSLSFSKSLSRITPTTVDSLSSNLGGSGSLGATDVPDSSTES